MDFPPINVDRSLAPKFFKGATDLFVTSWFRTIQGEGPFAGHPSVFLRLAGCNFGAKDPESACRWCDTYFKIDSSLMMTPSDAASRVLSVHGYRPSDVFVLTGGEPLLQHSALDLLDLLAGRFASLQIETNGTVESFLDKLVGRVANFHTKVVVSPKANYTTGKYAPLKSGVRSRLDALKFVLEVDPASPHHTIPDWAFALRDERQIPLYVSPMARYKKAPASEVASIWDDELIDRETTAANYAYAADYAIKNGLLLSLQTHLFTAVP